jgi:hypothetical protein
VLAVPVSLRNVGAEADVVDLARERFGELLKETSGDRAPRLARAWTQLCRDGRIVVLADGLDELTTGAALEREEAARTVLEKTRHRDVGVVVTSRASTPPQGLALSVYELGPLEGAASGGGVSIDYIVDRALAPVPEAFAGGLKRLIEAGDLGGKPVYLNIVARLRDLAAPELDRLVADASTAASDGNLRARRLRQRLLDAYHDAVQKRARGSQSTPDRAALRALEHLEWIGYACVRLNSLEPTLDEIAEALESVPNAPERKLLDEAVDGGRRLGFVHARPHESSVRVRFGHAIFEAYFAARLLDREVGSPQLLELLMAESYTVEFGTTLLLYCANRPPRSKRACDDLLARARDPRKLGLPDDTRLPSVATAAELAAELPAGTYDELRGEIAAEAWSAWDGAAYQSRHAAIPSIAGLSTRAAYQTLWRITGVPQYALRLAAARELIDDADRAYESLVEDIDSCVGLTEKDPRSWDLSELHEMSVLGWMLPSWRTRARGRTPELTEHLGRLLELTGRDDVHVGFEASLAQGFKLDAYSTPDAEPDADAAAFLPKARFWYSGISLVHALVLRAAPRGLGEQRKLLLDTAGDESAHPFVRRAAELGVRALDRRDAGPYVWGDEAEAIAGDGRDLDPEASQLLADVAVVLNLTEREGWQDRRDQIDDLYSRKVLPRCVSANEDRAELLARLPRAEGERCCEFDLCPYPPPWSTGARGELSPAFCREQRRVASAWRLRRRPPFLHRYRLPWQSSIRRRELVTFWEWMERRSDA